MGVIIEGKEMAVCVLLANVLAYCGVRYVAEMSELIPSLRVASEGSCAVVCIQHDGD